MNFASHAKEDCEKYKLCHVNGGSLHIVLEDCNWERTHIEYCRDFAKEREDYEGWKLASTLLSLSVEELCEVAKAVDDAEFSIVDGEVVLSEDEDFDDDPIDYLQSEPLVRRAAVFAQQAHMAINQSRKYTGLPYFTHCQNVANLVRSIGGTPEMVAAAYLHDVVEDVPLDGLKQVEKALFSLVNTTPEDTRETRLRCIYVSFGQKVADLVDQVTDISKPSDGNRKLRKALDREHLAKASPEAQTIKLADLIDNSLDIQQNDPDFAKVYMAEKRELLKVLWKSDVTLFQKAAEILIAYEEAQLQEKLK